MNEAIVRRHCPGSGNVVIVFSGLGINQPERPYDFQRLLDCEDSSLAAMRPGKQEDENGRQVKSPVSFLWTGLTARNQETSVSM